MGKLFQHVDRCGSDAGNDRRLEVRTRDTSNSAALTVAEAMYKRSVGPLLRVRSCCFCFLRCRRRPFLAGRSASVAGGRRSSGRSNRSASGSTSHRRVARKASRAAAHDAG